MRTVTAEVTITDSVALHEAVARAEQNFVTIGLPSDRDEAEGPAVDPEFGPPSDALDAVAWLTWPTEGMDDALESGAFRILQVSSEAVAESVDQGRVTWRATVQLTDVDELRRLAAEAHPEEAGSIADSLAIAWQCAADPFAPLSSIPGISWRPGQVDVEHLPAKAVWIR